MPDDNTETDEVRIEIDGIQADCDVLANSLATFGPLDSWPRFLWNHYLSPDATPAGLYMVRRFDPMPLPTPTGQHIKLYGPPRSPQDAAQGPGGAFISTTPAIEIDLSPIDGKHCTLRARADRWAGSMLVHMLLHSGEERDRAVWSTVCAAFPVLYEAFNRIRKLLFNPVKIILSYVNTDADSMSRWLVRNTDFAFLHHQRENDGGQTWLTPGLANRSERTENGLTFFDRTVRVGAWLISRPDTRGILGAAYVGDMV